MPPRVSRTSTAPSSTRVSVPAQRSAIVQTDVQIITPELLHGNSDNNGLHLGATAIASAPASAQKAAAADVTTASAGNVGGNQSATGAGISTGIAAGDSTASVSASTLASSDGSQSASVAAHDMSLEQRIQAWFAGQSLSETLLPLSDFNREQGQAGYTNANPGNTRQSSAQNTAQEWARMDALLKAYLEGVSVTDAEFGSDFGTAHPFTLFQGGGGNASQLSLNAGQNLHALSGLKEGIVRLG